MTNGQNFGARNDAYQAFRISYPRQLFDVIENAAPQMGRKLAIDLGSGTGISIEPLLDRFDRVVAVEPDARMAERIEASERLRIEVSPSEDFDAMPKSVDLVTAATAFYWMDGPTVIEKMARWLHADGLVAVYRYALPALPAALAGLIDREFKSRWDSFRHPRLLDEEYSWRCFQESDRFANKKRQLIANRATMNWQTFVGFFGSTSYVGAYLRSIDDPAAYIASLENEVLDLMAEDDFPVDFPIELILASSPH